jgi:hypothetical protein
MNLELKSKKKFLYRLAIILTVYILIILIGVIYGQKLDNQISPYVFENPTITIQTYLDDFIRVRISCYWEDKPVNFIVRDEFNNLRHNSSVLLSCQGYKTLDLQGQPQDYETDRKYQVEVNFDNQTIKSSYFYLANHTRIGLIEKETRSFFTFMIYQSSLARGSYSDKQRLLYADTKDPIYAEGFIKAHALGIISTFTIFFIIDIGIWIFIFIRGYILNGRKVKRVISP